MSCVWGSGHNAGKCSVNEVQTKALSHPPSPDEMATLRTVTDSSQCQEWGIKSARVWVPLAGAGTTGWLPMWWKQKWQNLKTEGLWQIGHQGCCPQWVKTKPILNLVSFLPTKSPLPKCSYHNTTCVCQKLNRWNHHILDFQPPKSVS